MKFGVVVFPGSNCDQDCLHVLKEVVEQPVAALWHEETSLKHCDAIVLPGGFSYGDYLRTGAIARFSPIMRAVTAFANDGGLVIGICNGFQILLEAGLLPGAMLRNTGLRFICRFVTLRVERADTPFTNRFQQGQIVRMPIAHNEGRYIPQNGSGFGVRGSGYLPTAHSPQPRAPEGLVLFRYCDAEGQVTESANPNGSTEFVAGITNRAGNVMGLMPHPERAAEPELGSSDGRLVFESMIEAYTHV